MENVYMYCLSSVDGETKRCIFCCYWLILFCEWAKHLLTLTPAPLCYLDQLIWTNVAVKAFSLWRSHSTSRLHAKSSVSSPSKDWLFWPFCPKFFRFILSLCSICSLNKALNSSLACGKISCNFPLTLAERGSAAAAFVCHSADCHAFCRTDTPFFQEMNT